VHAGIGEHAEVERRPGATGVVEDHEGVVEDVGLLAAVALVEVVDVLAARGHHLHRALADEQVHQVEEVGVSPLSAPSWANTTGS
jgi:hypothetical protein